MIIVDARKELPQNGDRVIFFDDFQKEFYSGWYEDEYFTDDAGYEYPVIKSEDGETLEEGITFWCYMVFPQ